MDSRARNEYIQHGFGDRFTKYQPDADLIVDKEFEEQCVPGSVKLRLDHVQRINRHAKGEWIKYIYTLIGRTRYNQERNRNKSEGMWKKPIFEIVVDENGASKEIDKVHHFEEIWTVPYTAENVKKILALDEFNNNVAMSIQDGEDSGSMTYTVIDTDKFINAPFSELLPKVRY